MLHVINCVSVETKGSLQWLPFLLHDQHLHILIGKLPAEYPVADVEINRSGLWPESVAVIG